MWVIVPLVPLRIPLAKSFFVQMTLVADLERALVPDEWLAGQLACNIHVPTSPPLEVVEAGVASRHH